MHVISDKVIFANNFAECYSGEYFFNCDTLEETRSCLRTQRIFLDRGWKLTEMEKIPKDAYCILVKFSTKENYTEHEYLWMRVLKKNLKSFINRLEETL